MIRRLLWLLCALVLLGGLGWTGATLAMDARVTSLSGLRVDGQRLPPTTDPRAELQARADRWLDQPLGVRAGSVMVVRTRRQLGARVDVEGAVERVSALGRAGGTWRNVNTWWDARRGRIDVPLATEVDRAAIQAFVSGLTDLVDREPVVARYSRSGELLEAGMPGLTLDVDASTDAIATAVLDEEVVLELQVIEDQQPAAPEPPPVQSFGEVVATYSTRFGRNGGRAHNVRLAAERLDGALIAPGGELSFNGQVGARDRRDGFRTAPVIEGGEMVDGVGGGTCQVASTLHAAAFLGGLQIVEHRPHSRPAGYVPLGLDATVVWPNVDLVVRNPYGFPVLVRATHAGRTLRVDLLGARRPPDVRWERAVAQTDEPSERLVEDPSIPWGEARVTQDGIPGYLVVRTRTMDRGHGLITERETLRYPATDRVVRMAPVPPK